MFRLASALRKIFIAAFAAALALAPSAFAKGIVVKFLPCAAEDSIARYDIYRSAAAGLPGLAVGSIVPSGLPDTLRYPDLAVEKGFAYFYSIRGVSASGLESDPSDQTAVGIPRLSLPDTLRPDPDGVTRFKLPAAAAPLPGETPVIAPAGSSPFAFRHDSAGGWIEFRPRTAAADTAAVTLLAAYFGKFSDLDTALVIVAGAGPVTSLPPRTPRAESFRAPAGGLDVTGFRARGGLRDARGRLLPSPPVPEIN